MHSIRLRDGERRLVEEGRLKYKGTARVKIDSFYFPWSELGSYDKENVKRLKGNFETYECRRLESKNFIPAVVDQQELDAAIGKSPNISAEILLNNTGDVPPELIFRSGYRLACLHGEDRIQAGREFLRSWDRWWTVDLYISGA